MSRFAVIERASIDEAYMDLTSAVQERLKGMTDKWIEPDLLKTTYIQGYPHTVNEQEASAEERPVDKGTGAHNTLLPIHLYLFLIKLL